MDFIESTKGARILCKDGFLYNKSKTFPNGNTYWECRERRSGVGAAKGCLSKVTLDPNSQFINLTQRHCHPSDTEKIAVLRARSRMKADAKKHNKHDAKHINDERCRNECGGESEATPGRNYSP